MSCAQVCAAHPGCFPVSNRYRTFARVGRKTCRRCAGIEPAGRGLRPLRFPTVRSRTVAGLSPELPCAQPSSQCEVWVPPVASGGCDDSASTSGDDGPRTRKPPACKAGALPIAPRPQGRPLLTSGRCRGYDAAPLACSPAWIRTRTMTSVNSRPLCQLSYKGSSPRTEGQRLRPRTCPGLARRV